MWISRTRFDALEKRIRDLEIERECSGFTFYDEARLNSYRMAGIWDYSGVPQQKLSVKQVIERILSHVGMEMKYVEGTPATVAVNKVKAK